jgi:hypothetical protein
MPRGSFERHTSEYLHEGADSPPGHLDSRLKYFFHAAQAPAVRTEGLGVSSEDAPGGHLHLSNLIPSTLGDIAGLAPSECKAWELSCPPPRPLQIQSWTRPTRIGTIEAYVQQCISHAHEEYLVWIQDT